MFTFKRKFSSLAVLLAFFTTTFLTFPAQAAGSCVLSTMTDPLALRMEAGDNVIWDNVSADVIAAKNRYVNLVKAKGWSITINSAYRPYQYQKHLYEIVQNPVACSAEKAKHGLGTEVAYPDYNAPHTAGLAFDATIFNASGVALNGRNFVNSALIPVAEQAGLHFRLPTSDGVHHELLPNSGSVLGVGSTGPAVTTLQTNLNKVGYTVNVDGSFGSDTESVVKQFQSAHGLTVDGKVGSATSTKLNALATTTTVLRVGSKGDEVKVLQRLLTKKGYSLTADGAFGSGTEVAVKSFQQSKGLTVDGVVGAATWNKLRS